MEHGRKAALITWPDIGEQVGRTIGSRYKKDPSLELVLSLEDEYGAWILELRDGVEVSRHNLSCLESIYWEK